MSHGDTRLSGCYIVRSCTHSTAMSGPVTHSHIGCVVRGEFISLFVVNEFCFIGCSLVPNLDYRLRLLTVWLNCNVDKSYSRHLNRTVLWHAIRGIQVKLVRFGVPHGGGDSGDYLLACDAVYFFGTWVLTFRICVMVSIFGIEASVS